MHYIPESTRAYLEGDASAISSSGDSDFHAASAPLYLLTAAVALLLGLDLFLGSNFSPAEWKSWQTVLGYRLALWAAVVGGAHILYQALDGLFSGRIGADLALAVACLAAILLGEHVVAALVVLISLCGNSLEGYTVDRAASVLKRTLNLHPDIGHLLRDGIEQDVPVKSLAVDDLVVVRPGERIPVDGIVTNGSSTVDESTLTGESRAREKSPGESVYTGSLNQFGALTVRVERVGESTRLGQIIKLVSEAGSRKAKLERIADRMARAFLPFVAAAALITVVVWRLKTGSWSAAWIPGLSVLVVACPCPLILATPTAVLAGLAWLARHGIVVKGSAALERLADVDVFAFDKTGTLTGEHLQLGDVLPRDGLNSSALLRLVAGAEKRSEHPLARLLVESARRQNLEVPEPEEFSIEPGLGVVARFASASVTEAFGEIASASPPQTPSVQVFVGNRQWLTREPHQLEISPDWDERLRQLDESGQSTVLVGIRAGSADAQSPPGEILGVLGVRHVVRREAQSMLQELRQLGIRQLALLTGDRLIAAERIARSLPELDQVGAEMLPSDKAHWVEQHIAEGAKVAMVGDGVNDAPALAVSTVGLALTGSGSDLAADAGDILLLHDPLKSLPSLVRLSRQLVAIIRQSIFFFAVLMNLFGIVLSACGVLSPVGAALFHEGASLAVMLNALRLLWFESRVTTGINTVWQSALEWGDLALREISPAGIARRLTGRWGLVFRLAVAVCILVWCGSNCVILSSDEQGMVTRCGRFQSLLSPGMHFCWPYPFERVYREKVERLRSVQVGYRAARGRAPTRGAFQPPVEWQTEHVEPGYQAIPNEAFALVADEVAVEITAEADYRIVDYRRFQFSGREPAETARAAIETALRQVLSQSPLENLLTTDRPSIERETLRRARSILGKYQLGIELAEVHLLDLHPPVPVVPSYRDVANAMEEQEQSINLAQLDYAKQVLTAAGDEAIRLLSRPAELANEKKSARIQPMALAGAVHDWKLTDSLWQELTVERGVRSVLSGTAAARLNTARREADQSVQIARGQQSRFMSLLATFRSQTGLTQFELFWDRVEKLMTSRPLMIVDPRAASRQHLYLIDPDRFTPRLLPPIPAPAARSGTAQENSK